MMFSRPAMPPAAFLFTPDRPPASVTFDAPCPGCGRMVEWREWPTMSGQHSEATGITFDCGCETRP